MVGALMVFPKFTNGDESPIDFESNIGQRLPPDIQHKYYFGIQIANVLDLLSKTMQDRKLRLNCERKLWLV